VIGLRPWMTLPVFCISYLIRVYERACLPQPGALGV
jgi:hypothetical protein